MEQRLSLITPGVGDVPRAQAFYGRSAGTSMEASMTRPTTSHSSRREGLSSLSGTERSSSGTAASRTRVAGEG